MLLCKVNDKRTLDTCIEYYVLNRGLMTSDVFLCHHENVSNHNVNCKTQVLYTYKTMDIQVYVLKKIGFQ